MYDGILFDVDGVLLDSRELLWGSWRAWARSRSLDPELVLAVTHGRRPDDTLREVAAHLDPVRERRYLDDLVLAGIDAVRPLPGAVELLRRLDGRPWAVVSSGTRWFVQRCFHAGGLPLPAVQVYGEDVAEGKPSPEGYLAAAAGLGLDPARCLVVEDAPSGVAAGRAAGCTVVAVCTTHAAEALGEADLCLPDLAAVWTHITRTVEVANG